MPEYVTFPTARCVRATSKAILVDVDGEEVWIPQSQVHDDSEVWRAGDEGKLVISEWIAKRKGLL
jgi:Ser-tRNA(Ala) deacylase AlaX